MVPRLLPLVLLVFFLAAPVPARAATGDSQAPNPQDRSDRVKNGVSHFDRAFYVSIPHGRGADAAREFDLAVAEFEAELRASPDSIEAHRYLARIFTVRRQFRQAATHYDAVCRVDPADADAHVLAALAWAEAGSPAEARERLLAAKSRARDPIALAKLDEYLARLDRNHPASPK